MPLNLYADLVMFKRRYANDATLDAVDTAEIEKVLDSASRMTDRRVRRHYFAKTATPAPYAGNGCDHIWIDDLLSATTIKLDEDGDRTFELTLAAATDYYLKRHGADDEDGLPKTMLILDGVNGQRGYFARRKRLVQIVGSWGYTNETEAVEASGTAITGTLDNATDLTLAVSNAADLAIGQTLLLESEQVYISGGTASPFTVKRGVNGTTAAAHAAVAVNRYVYTSAAREATLIIAGRRWQRRLTSYSNVISNPEMGSIQVWKAKDPEVEALLGPETRGDTLVA